MEGGKDSPWVVGIPSKWPQHTLMHYLPCFISSSYRTRAMHCGKSRFLVTRTSTPYSSPSLSTSLTVPKSMKYLLHLLPPLSKISFKYASPQDLSFSVKNKCSFPSLLHLFMVDALDIMHSITLSSFVNIYHHYTMPLPVSAKVFPGIPLLYSL